jgi:hypothetical protein
MQQLDVIQPGRACEEPTMPGHVQSPAQPITASGSSRAEVYCIVELDFGGRVSKERMFSYLPCDNAILLRYA